MHVRDAEFCELLGQDLGGAKLPLLVEGKTLRRLPVDHSDDALIDQPRLTLMYVLRKHHLTAQAKVLLAYILARSVWQYYESDWMKSRWTGDSICFLLEDPLASGENSIYLDKPCFSVQFGHSDEELPEYCSDDRLLHKYPRLLSLGLLLLDIGRKLVGNNDDSTRPLDWKARTNAECERGRRIVAGDPAWPNLGYGTHAREQIRQMYKTAAQSCFDNRLFSTATINTPRKHDAEITQRRRKIYEHVVWPLERAVIDMGLMRTLGQMAAITIASGELEGRLIPEGPKRQKSIIRLTGSSIAQGVGTSELHARLSINRSRSGDRSIARLFDDEVPSHEHTMQQ